MQMGAFGRTWAVATPHASATEAAVVAYERGGNAIDAALAAATTLAVVYPHMCGVGGDLFALVQHPAGDVVAINASGRAPEGADPATAAAAGRGRMPEHGPLSVTVPGAVSGWKALHERGANLPWADAFTAAVTYAYGGVSVAPSLALTLAEDADRLRRDPGLADVFFPRGLPAAVLEPVRQPALGASLQEIADLGPAALYGGELGARYAVGLRELGVPIELADMAGHRADLRAPLRARHRDVDVLVHPPNSQGFVLLEALSVIERLGIDPDPLGLDAAVIADVLRATARDRDLHLADEDAMRLQPSTLLEDGHLAALAAEVRDGSSAAPPPPTHRSGDTIALVTADVEGRGVSLIQSLFDGFGAGLLERATGVVAQSRGACFTLEPGHPNVLAPGKRPLHTLMPVLVQREGRLEAVAGTMGGFAQPQIVAMTLLRAFGLGMDAAGSVAAPRWLVGWMSQEGPRPDVVAESGVPAEVLDRLKAGGYRVDTVGERDESVGHANLIRAVAGGFDAGSDPRADGGAAAS
ncbi:MAG: gamma-glutamyltransferase family protein [Actinomycetota bacterium]